MDTRLWKPGLTLLVSGILVMMAGAGPVRNADVPATEKSTEKSGVVQAGCRYKPRFRPRSVVDGSGSQIVDGTTVYNRGDCPPDDSWKYSKRGKMVHSAKCHCAACRARCQQSKDCINCRKWYAADPYYVDRRDGQVFSAVGYNVPVSVPLAPVVGYSYNYGWGIPSSRLTRIGSTYDRWYPQTWYTLAGAGPEAAGPNPPIIYTPTDTTQQGFYYKHVPAWQPAPLGGWPNYPVIPRFTR